jgi:phosphate transport system substrate-binding protein
MRRAFFCCGVAGRSAAYGASDHVASGPPVGSMNSLDLQKARADALRTKGMRRAYTREFDLSELP